MFFKKKSVVVPDEIVNFNTFPPEKEKLLCVGAAVTIFAERDMGAKPQYLKLYFTDKQRKNLAKYWLPMFGIEGGEHVRPLVESWISANSYEPVVSLETKDKVRTKILKDGQAEGVDVQSLLDSVERVKDSGAFDLERLGYIVRVCFSLGLISEADAWEYLKELHKLASEHYHSWDDYIVSYSNENEAMNTSWYKDIVVHYLAIKKQPGNLLDKYPLG